MPCQSEVEAKCYQYDSYSLSQKSVAIRTHLNGSSPFALTITGSSAESVG